MLHLARGPQRLSVTGKLPSTGAVNREPVMRTKVPNDLSKSAIALRYAMSDFIVSIASALCRWCSAIAC
jgi:hypothetical protein